MEIKLKAKSVYGKVLVYPVCEKSNLLIRLTGKKTFDDTDMFLLERLSRKDASKYFTRGRYRV
jgi:hypothetical protein